MRIIDVCGAPIRTLGLSPDGQFVAAATVRAVGVFDRATGSPVLRRDAAACPQFAFAPDGRWVAYTRSSGLRFDRLGTGGTVPPELPGSFAGGVAVSPDGKKLVATRIGGARSAELAVWGLPDLRPQVGYADWPPFSRLAFSRNGEFLAGIWSGTRSRGEVRIPQGWTPLASARFEMRFARSGGGDYHYPPMHGPAFDTPGFVALTHDSATCAFGWDGEFHVLDLSTGTARESKYIKASFRDAAFTGSGRHLGTVEHTGVLKLWDVRTWQVAREYDWRCGPLTSVAFTADGTAGVCGTADGRLVQFDVDE
jgi:WD40 repeat protein